jgi:hypothetical protein
MSVAKIRGWIGIDPLASYLLAFPPSLCEDGAPGSRFFLSCGRRDTAVAGSCFPTLASQGWGTQSWNLQTENEKQSFNSFASLSLFRMTTLSESIGSRGHRYGRAWSEKRKGPPVRRAFCGVGIEWRGSSQSRFRDAWNQNCVVRLTGGRRSSTTCRRRWRWLRRRRCRTRCKAW